MAWFILLLVWGLFAWGFVASGPIEDALARGALLVALFVGTYARGRADEEKSAEARKGYDWPGIRAYWREEQP